MNCAASFFLDLLDFWFLLRFVKILSVGGAYFIFSSHLLLVLEREVSLIVMKLVSVEYTFAYMAFCSDGELMSDVVCKESPPF